MLRSMFTAISSLTLHQSYMDVISDNLANANTPGFKASQVSFQDQFAELMAAGAAPIGGLGGINPMQIGLGTRLGSITRNFSQGMLSSTGRTSDLAMQGEGFFIYSDNITRYYSRDGSLEMDANGYLVNSATGYRIQGWESITGSGSVASVDTGQPLGDIQIPVGSTLARATENVYLGGNLDSTSTSGSVGAYNLTVGVYDSLGELHTVTITYTRTADNTWSWDATSGATGSGTLTFDSEGQYIDGSGSITVPASGGASATVVNLDMSGITQLATDNSAAAISQDGLAAGSLAGFNVISNTGEIIGLYSNGLQQSIGQVAVADFVNPAGLVRTGQNLYLAGLNSGEPDVGIAGTGGRGTVVSGFIESSNVDLGREFTNMILAVRGFQASSRVITTSDEILQELVNITR